MELRDKTVKELEGICKELGLTYYVGKKHITKQEMIEKIEEVSVNKNTNESVESECEENLAKGFSEKEDKFAYIEKAEVGAFVAFVDEKGKARTGALQNRSSKKQLVKLETEYGREYIVPYDNVLWVKKYKNSRWPRGVYNMLKGKKDEEEING